MSEYKDVLGALSVLFALTAYILYLRDIFVHHTKPHAFSWLVWGVLAGIAFAAQYVGDAGAGSWVTFLDIFLCTIIFIIALRIGEKSYVLFDWVAILLAFASLFFWWLTKSPTISVILITLVDFFGFLPTYRKSFDRPWEESASMYFLSFLKYSAALFAISTYSISTAFYVGSLIPINAALVAMIFIRRHQIRAQ